MNKYTILALSTALFFTTNVKAEVAGLDTPPAPATCPAKAPDFNLKWSCSKNILLRQ